MRFHAAPPRAPLPGRVLTAPCDDQLVEIASPDTVVVQSGDQQRRVTLSSIALNRAPRPGKEGAGGADDGKQPATRSAQLYETPFWLEAREHLRKAFLDQEVRVVLDFVRPATDAWPERQYGTVYARDNTFVRRRPRPWVFLLSTLTPSAA